MSVSTLKGAKLFGAGLLITAVVLLIVNPKPENNLPAGFYTPIVAFEFMQHKQDVLDFFRVKDVAAYESSMLLGNAIDYLFMILYSGFLACIALYIKKRTSAKSMYVVLVCCVLMWLGDALENYQIYQLVIKHRDNMELVNSVSSYNYYDIHITLLKFFTWLKWSSIAVAFLLLSPFFFKGNLFYKVIGIVSVFCFCLCIAAFFKHGILNEVFASSVVVVFLLLAVFVFTFKEKAA